MKITFIKYKKLLIVFSILFIPLMFISIYRIEYTFVAPGFNDDISYFIIIDEGSDTNSTFHTTSVLVQDKITILQYLIGTPAKTVTVKEFPKYYDNLDLDDLNIMSYLMKDDSLATSLVVGIRNTGYEIDYDTYFTVYLTFDNLTIDSLVIGDKVLEINGRTDFEDALDDVICGEDTEYKILRGKEELVVYVVQNELDDATCPTGVYFDYFTEINSTEIDYTIIETDTGGPSGGLMQSLYIYYQLVDTNFEEDLKIAGTGTIDVNGEVGSIGGIKQKIITSALNKVDIYFVPYLSDDSSDNYIEALRVYNTLDTEMVLVGISTFSEAIDYLVTMESGDDNE